MNRFPFNSPQNEYYHKIFCGNTCVLFPVFQINLFLFDLQNCFITLQNKNTFFNSFLNVFRKHLINTDSVGVKQLNGSHQLNVSIGII